MIHLYFETDAFVCDATLKLPIKTKCLVIMQNMFIVTVNAIYQNAYKLP